MRKFLDIMLKEDVSNGIEIVEKQFRVPNVGKNWFKLLKHGAESISNGLLLRAIAIKSTPESIIGECLVTDGWSGPNEDIFDFKKRAYEDTSTFNTVVVIPTGVGAELGGHAGDAGPLARLFGTISDKVVIHPNVVNASDINEMPENALYIEGSTLTRMMMGQIELQPVRNNRMLVIVGDGKTFFVKATINAVNAAVSSYGLDCHRIAILSPRFEMTSEISKTGRASGKLTGVEHMFRILDKEKGNYDAVAIATKMKLPEGYGDKYFANPDSMVNPWGGVESMLTHAISYIYNVPSAHSPIPSQLRHGVQDPRLAAEAITLSAFECVLKGLQRSPKILKLTSEQSELFGVKNVSVFITPDKCIGLPLLAALYQGIPVIAVENENAMENDLNLLPWRKGQFHRAANYQEAVGIATALKAGINLGSTKRPLEKTPMAKGY